jgi:hypothetical protein
MHLGDGRLVGDETYQQEIDGDRVRRWAAGFYFGAAADRLHAVADRMVTSKDDGWIPDQATSRHCWFKSYVDWFKHGKADKRPKPLPSFADAVLYFEEVFSALVLIRHW